MKRHTIEKGVVAHSLSNNPLSACRYCFRLPHHTKDENRKQDKPHKKYNILGAVLYYSVSHFLHFHKHKPRCQTAYKGYYPRPKEIKTIYQRFNLCTKKHHNSKKNRHKGQIPYICIFPCSCVEQDSNNQSNCYHDCKHSPLNNTTFNGDKSSYLLHSCHCCTWYALK